MKSNLRSQSLTFITVIGALLLLWLQISLTTAQVEAAWERQEPESLLAIYVLAFDNDPNEAMSLTSYYTSTVAGIAESTALSSEKTGIILADLDEAEDTHILIVKNGQISRMAELPLELAEHLTIPSKQELDMSDGVTLGTFFAWAQDTYPADSSTLSFIGHGESIVPKVNFEPNENAAVPDSPQPTPAAPALEDAAREEPIAPLPARWGAHQGLTDYHSASLLSIYDLSVALSMATNDGADPFAVVDLVQCFSSSIEELYELHPYAETILGAPNYMYSKPSMVGKALAAVEPSMSAADMASTMLATYDGELPVEGHPRLMVGVESSKIPAVKDAWDNTSLYLAEAMTADLDDAKLRIRTAYTQSAKYDTSLCEQLDFALAPPDAMSDMSDFATQLSSAFGQTSPVGSWALTTTQRIDEAIIARHAHGGVPWFAEGENPPEWSLHGPGISLFTDFSADSPEGLSWQAYWYTDTTSTQVQYPFTFLQNSADNASWADVFTTYWGYGQISAGRPVTSTADQRLADCRPAFLSGRGPGELSAANLAVTMPGGDVSAASRLILRDGLAFSMTVDLQSQDEAANPQVLFNIYRNGRRIMSEVETPGYVDANSVSQVALGRNWQALYPGLYEFEVIIDADQRFTEPNEENNTLRLAIEVVESVKVHLPFIY